MKRIRVGERCCPDRLGRAERGQFRPILQCRSRQTDSIGEVFDPVGAGLRAGFFKRTEVMQRDRTADRCIRAEALFALFNIQLLVEQPPPEDYFFTGQIGIDLVRCAAGRHAGIRSNLAAFGFPGKRAEPLPSAHGTHAGNGKILQPVFHPRMMLMAVLPGVVTHQEIQQPRVGLGFVLGFVEVIQGLVHLFDRAKRPFDLAFRPGGHAPTVRASRHMEADLDAEITHHPQKDEAARHRSTIHVDHQGDTLKRESFVMLGAHGIE